MQFPKQAPCTVWVTACFIFYLLSSTEQLFNVCLCSFSPSPAMGNIDLAALFSWGHIRTVYFGFYRNSASLSHCTFICSSDNSKDQQRCPWDAHDNLLSCGRKKTSLFSLFSFFFVDLYFMDLMNNQIITENNKPRCDKAVPHGNLESQLQSICQSCVREVCLWFIAVLSQTRVKLGTCLKESPPDVNLYAVCMNLVFFAFHM